jgi:pyruvate, water dikinase
MTYVAWLKDLRMSDLPQVGGKNASLGEMIGALAASGIRVPGGFATTADAYREFLKAGGLDQRIAKRIAGLETGDVEALARCGAEIRGWIESAPLPEKLEQGIHSYYQELIKTSSSDISFAIRSSATAEDLPDASFAGQQETFLNVHGIDHVLQAIRQVFASLYNDRAISSHTRASRTATWRFRPPCSRWCAATAAQAG